MKRFGIALALGVLLVFVHEIWGLVRALRTAEGSLEEGAIWAILLMIFAVIAVVGGIGGGLYRALRRGEARSSPDVAPGPGGRDRGEGTTRSREPR